MGHNSARKKKKKNKGGGRTPSKDNSSSSAEGHSLSEEITALAGIYQDDITILSEPSYTRFDINLRPYSNDIVGHDLNVSARLVVRCLPGYPHKSPKIQIIPQKGLSKKDADRLHSLLVDQANINAREGQVMIHNLVLAAQEFISGIAPAEQLPESAPHLDSTRKEQLLHKDLAASGFFEGEYVHVSVDLYSDLCGDEASWGNYVKAATDNFGKISREETRLKAGGKTTLSDSFSIINTVNAVTAEVLHPVKHGATSRVTNLNVLQEETDNEDQRMSPSICDVHSTAYSSDKASDSTLHKDDLNLEEQVEADGSQSDYEYEASTSISCDNESQMKKKDLLMVHLLRLACVSKGSLYHALPGILSELYESGMLSEQAKDLAAEPSPAFHKAFAHAFEDHMISSRISQFWKPINGVSEDNASSVQNSRYLNDFEEIRSLGHGGFGYVVLCKNKLDGRQYAVKKIRLKDKDVHLNEKILREVATLSRLQHQHIVRYYQAWCETQYGSNNGDNTCGSKTEESCSWSCTSTSLTNATGPDNPHELTFLYIQMEYCPRTLRQDFDDFDSSSASFDKEKEEYTWHLFRQIVEGLAHIHSLGIIHRDLNPSNIFFDARNEIKIGDFGLAKFLKREQLDHDQYFPIETTGVSMDGTGQVGTFFYTAPEIEQRWPKINEKVDIYSLGVVFFELWHPFKTAMERHIILSDLKQKGTLPSKWAEDFPKQAAILERLMSPSPSERPDAADLLNNDLPPQMADDRVKDILRSIQSPDNINLYLQVVSAIFAMNRLMPKDDHDHNGNTKAIRDESCFIQYSEIDTELRENAIEVIEEVFKQHGAKRLEIPPMRVLDGYDGDPIDRSVKTLTPGGYMLEHCYELRAPFINWVIINQKSSFKRYAIEWVYRRAIGNSSPNRFLQGDFDIVGGATSLTEAEAIKVVVDIINQLPNQYSVDIRLNHGQILGAIWSWVGISSRESRLAVAELLSSIGSFSPQSTSHKSNWKFIRRQLLKDLKLSEALVDRLQTASLRFCGSLDQALARLRGALFSDKYTHKALEELSTLSRYLRIWNIDNSISLDVLMPATEDYYRGLFFQIYLKGSTLGSVSEGTLLAVGGRYDSIVHQKWNQEYKSNAPGAVGVSIALDKILFHCPVDPSFSVLVCSKGGGGLLQERMELVAELWQANIKAQLVPLSEPSFTDQYEYATEHDIKCLIIITEAGLAQGLLRVRHLELKKEKDIERGEITKFLSRAAISPHTRDLKEWN